MHLKPGWSSRNHIFLLPSRSFRIQASTSPQRADRILVLHWALKNSPPNMSEKVGQWCAEVDKRAVIAVIQPHAAYAAMTHGLTSKWIHISRTVSNIGPLLHPLEERIRTKLIPALTGRSPPNDIERKLLALPSRLGGIGLVDPTETSAMEYSSSLRVAAPLIHLILAQDPRYPFEALEEQIMAKTEIRREKSEQQSEAAKLLKSTLPRSLQRAVDLAQEKGASSWLTVLPDGYGFLPPQKCFQRCSGSEIWVAALTNTFPLCLWHPL